jgi:8-oxo-dGTP pyrophosphatase MutT (NUDIX family)
MHRNPLITLLSQYDPLAPEEQSTKIRMLDCIKTYDNCFDRSLFIGHITASAWLLNKDLTKALIMHHAKLDMWVQLGGHCDGNPNPLQVALKEAQEESGIQNIEPIHDGIFDIDIHFIPATPKEPEHYHYDVRFLLRVTGDEKYIQNEESKALRWIGKEAHELPTQAHSILRMFEKWITAYEK